CRSSEEAHDVLTRLLPQLFSGTPGAVCLIDPSRSTVEASAAWGTPPMVRESFVFSPDDCWALRRGQPHLVTDTARQLVCKHFADTAPASSLCQPLLAHGEVMGILCLGAAGPLGEELQRRAGVVGEQISLALANLYLRETLRNQSIR